MSLEADAIRLRHMSDASKAALSFAAGRSRADLDRDRMLVLALVKSLEIVGEAASKVSPETQSTMPEVPWRVIIGMRHRLIHMYFDIDVEVVWNTVQNDVPALIDQIDRWLSKH